MGEHLAARKDPARIVLGRDPGLVRLDLVIMTRAVSDLREWERFPRRALNAALWFFGVPEEATPQTFDALCQRNCIDQEKARNAMWRRGFTKDEREAILTLLQRFGYKLPRPEREIA